MIQISRILCPVDFSDHSRHALDHAKAVARWFTAPITVLHVHPIAMPAFAAGPTLASQAFTPVTLTEEARGTALGAIDAFVADDRAAGWEIDSQVEEATSVPAAIVSLAETLPVDVIVIGTHGRTGFNRLVLGSVTEKVLRTAPCPVLCVPPRSADATHSPATGISCVLCPIDFAASSTGTLRYAASIAEQARARLTVLHVVELAPDAGDVLVPEADVYRAARFEHANASMRAAIPAEIRQAGAVDELVVAGRPHQEIVRTAADQRAGLIVMGVHGRGVVDRMFFGSTTQHVVRQAPCPVLTIRDA